jgi:hypothetical protein
MADRVPSDHPSVASVRAELVRAGRTDRPRVSIPGEDAGQFPAGDVVRLVVDGSERFTRVAERTGGDGLELRGAHETPGDARDPGSGSDHLADWQDATGLDFGRAVLVDVVEADYKYGLRAPGERVTYEGGRPDSSLADIAWDLDG